MAAKAPKGPRGGARAFLSRAGSSVRRKTSDFLAGAKPLEMVLFGWGGNVLGEVLDASGFANIIGSKIESKFPGWTSQLQAHGMTYGRALTKMFGAGAFAYELGRSAHGKSVSGGHLNAVTPFAIGAMLDPPLEGPGGMAPTELGGW